MSQAEIDNRMMQEALAEARKSYNQGGLPIGAVLAEGETVVARGHNRRVQSSDPIAHGEMDCFRSAGRRKRYDSLTLYTTLSPCMMCTGTTIQFGVPRVVIGEDVNFPGNPELLRKYGVQVQVLENQECIDLMRRFIAENPELWDEDIAGRECV